MGPYPYPMMPSQPMYHNQNPMGYQQAQPTFPPQNQAGADQQPKMNFMAAKNVSFAPQLETPMADRG